LPLSKQNRYQLGTNDQNSRQSFISSRRVHATIEAIGVGRHIRPGLS
jgi:hypothetical protein